MNEHVQWYQRKAQERTAEALRSKGFEVYLAANRDEARKIVETLIKPGDKVGWGGSATLAEIGIFSRLTELGAEPMIPIGNISPAELGEHRRQALHADVYLTGCNAVSETGELVNIDGTGNRVASMCFGPRAVIMVIGRNKICPDIAAAIERAHSVAAPINAHRLGLKVPCAETGECGGCEDTGICNITLIMHRKPGKKPFHVVIVDEDLGF